MGSLIFSFLDWKNCSSGEFWRDYCRIHGAIDARLEAGVQLSEIKLHVIIAGASSAAAWKLYRGLIKIFSQSSIEAEHYFSHMTRIRSSSRRAHHKHLPACIRLSYCKGEKNPEFSIDNEIVIDAGGKFCTQPG